MHGVRFLGLYIAGTASTALIAKTKLIAWAIETRCKRLALRMQLAFSLSYQIERSTHFC